MFNKKYLAVFLFLIIAICAISAVNAEEITEDSEIISEDSAIDEIAVDESIEDTQTIDDTSYDELGEEASDDVIEMENPKEIQTEQTKDSTEEIQTEQTKDSTEEILASEQTDNDVLATQNSDKDVLSGTASKNAKITFYKQTGSNTMDKKVYFKVTDAETGKLITGFLNLIDVDIYKNGNKVCTIDSIDVSNGKGVIIWNDMDSTESGTFTIKIPKAYIYDDADDVYVTKVAQKKVSIKKFKVSLKAKKLSVPLKSKKKFKITVKNLPFTYTYVKLRISSPNKVTTAKLKTNSKGIATYNKVSKLSPGKHKVKISIADNDLTAKSITSYIIVQGKQSVLFKTKKISASFKSGKKFKAQVIDSKTKKAVKGVKVNLKVYTGKKAKTVTLTSNSKGLIKYSTSKLNIGKHKVVLKVKKTKLIKGKSKTTSIKITKATLKISAPKTTNVYKKVGKYKVKVTNKASGKPVKGIKVTMKVYTGKKFKTYNVKTNAKGIASFSTKSLSKGKHKVVINVKGNSKFKKASKTSSVKISTKIATEITLGNDKAWIYTNRIYITSYTYTDLRTLMLDFTPTLKGKDGHEIKESYSGKLEYFSSSGNNFASDTVEGTYGEYKHHIGQNVPFYGGHYVLTLKYDGNSKYSGTTFTKTYYLY